MTWLTVAWLEWYRGFIPSRRGGSDRRDWLWLAMLVALTTSLGMVSIGGSRGLLSSFRDLMLGHIPGAGIPIVVDAHVYVRRGLRTAYEAQVSAAIPGAQMHRHRYLNRRVVGYPRPEPGKKSSLWRDGEVGWVVSRDNPLWRTGSSDGGRPGERRVVLNREAFAGSRGTKADAVGGRFDCLAYRDRVLARMPDAFEGEANDSCADLTFIGLEVATAWSSTLMRFEVDWSDRLRGHVHPQMLLPDDVYALVQAASASPSLRLDPEAPSATGPWVSTFDVDATTVGEQRAGELARCLGLSGAGRVAGDDRTFVLAPPRPTRLLTRCAAAWAVPLREGAVSEAQEGHAAKMLPTEMELPCAPLGPDLAKTLGCPERGEGARGAARYGVLAGGDGTDSAVVYVDRGRDIMKAMLALTKLEFETGPTFVIQPASRDALVRFGFAAEISEALNSELLLLLGLLLLGVGTAQVSTVVTHRTFAFGVLVGKGWTWGSIFLMTSTQVLLSVCVGVACGWGVVAFVRGRLSVAVAEVSAHYPPSMWLSGDDLIPLGWTEFWVVLIAALATCWLCLWLHLLHKVIRFRDEAAELISSGR